MSDDTAHRLTVLDAFPRNFYSLTFHPRALTRSADILFSDNRVRLTRWVRFQLTRVGFKRTKVSLWYRRHRSAAKVFKSNQDPVLPGCRALISDWQFTVVPISWRTPDSTSLIKFYLSDKNITLTPAIVRYSWLHRAWTGNDWNTAAMDPLIEESLDIWTWKQWETTFTCHTWWNNAKTNN